MGKKWNTPLNIVDRDENFRLSFAEMSNFHFSFFLTVWKSSLSLFSRYPSWAATIRASWSFARKINQLKVSWDVQTKNSNNKLPLNLYFWRRRRRRWNVRDTSSSSSLLLIDTFISPLCFCSLKTNVGVALHVTCTTCHRDRMVVGSASSSMVHVPARICHLFIHWSTHTRNTIHLL